MNPKPFENVLATGPILCFLSVMTGSSHKMSADDLLTNRLGLAFSDELISSQSGSHVTWTRLSKCEVSQTDSGSVAFCFVISAVHNCFWIFIVCIVKTFS